MRQPGIFGQLNWDTYTVVILGFRTSAGQTPDSITKALDQGAVKLLSVYPFLTCQVINEGRSSTSSGTYRIVPYPPHSDGNSPVRQKDCRQLCPSYDEIIRAGAPFSMLDGEVLCPMRGMGYVYDQAVETPVFIIQANFIRGGLLLCFASMHNALDMNGQDILIRQFATLLRGEALDQELIAAGNQDADSIVPLLKEGEAVLAHDEMRRPSSLMPVNDAAPATQGLKARWIYWRFPRDKLTELKTLASQNTSARVSTNDAITAIYAQRLTAVRIAAGRLSRTESVHCLRAADGRARLDPPVPKGYLGHLVGLAYTEWPAARMVLEAPLSTVANDIRASLEKVDDHNIRSLATLIHTTEDKTTIFYGAKKKLGKDIFISSWAQMDLSRTCDFGPLLSGGGKDGRPDFVRRAKMDILPDLTYIMPKNKEGDMDLGACLFEEDIAALQEDGPWMNYTRMIG
ncbi:hypothetical protein G647_03061 [Cladophialophora carrionii CBS 160.54]|uniref:Trichothecene 3-O-acetyltransferase-like N-terminal domain-containing protein n=1 Tax=Cladophialophora carrionii CBS 160.54 TaxID=1279043 RepID=V9DHB3_9EURO|nr:uncharacterized protein G647_03061 [Cladophialophora carrionii CBS 160.54]ETI26284.1 hypothetical protein G647_03061 [Cladophialophora carrionii CBS 160.54]